MKKIAIFGATGNIGKPVTQELIKQGYQVSVMVRETEEAEQAFPENTEIVKGNLKYHYDLKNFLKGKDIVYCNLSILPNENESDWHSETDGLRDIISVSVECGIKRIIYLSSMLQYHQGVNGFDWWVFKAKNQGVSFIRDCGIPYTIFFCSNFMENFEEGYRRGKHIRIYGDSRFPMFYISALDYSKMVAKSIELPGNDELEYFVQGLNCYSVKEAAQVFIKYYKKNKLKLRIMPMWLNKIWSIFNSKIRYNTKISEAIYEYQEPFNAESTWKELGKPTITLKDFAENYAE